MNTTATITPEYNKTTVLFTTRLASAMDMLEMDFRLERREETEGVYDTFLAQLNQTADLYKVSISISSEYFKGYKDVIHELKVFIAKDYDRSDDYPELASEQVAGTLLGMVIDYFEWRYNINLNEHDVSHRDYITLACFKGY